jgi:hypothetical protein
MRPTTAKRSADACYVVVFDYRGDGGARLVGPFDAKSDASGWLDLQQFDYEANVCRVEAP